jgi:hypothetical protein
MSNYQYLIDAARRLSTTRHPKVLDFGTGVGEAVALGVTQGLEVYGVDTYAGHLITGKS